jgi:hypothetical protein
MEPSNLASPGVVLPVLSPDPGTIMQVVEQPLSVPQPAPAHTEPVGLPAPARAGLFIRDVESPPVAAAAQDAMVVNYVPETPGPVRKAPVPRQQQPAIQTTPTFLIVVRGAPPQPM